MFFNYYFSVYLNKIARVGHDYYFSNALSLHLNIVMIITLNIFNTRRKNFGSRTTNGTRLGRRFSKIDPITVL